MKKIVFVLALMAVIPTLGACRTTIDEDRVVIDDHNNHGHGTFCPPGQAKKGNC